MVACCCSAFEIFLLIDRADRLAVPDIAKVPLLAAVGEKARPEGGGAFAALVADAPVQGRYIIVDRLFERGELRLGAGKQARVVRIEREIARRRGRS